MAVIEVISVDDNFDPPPRCNVPGATCNSSHGPLYAVRCCRSWKSNKSENVWDRFTHEPRPGRIVNNDTGDVACDSYHKYKKDVELLREIGFDVYRLSLSWSRILPNGFANKISQDGLDYYKKVLAELEANGIEPLVTLYHWDHPQIIEDLGGWTNEEIVDYFGDYARVVFRELGPRVKYFCTINEPEEFCARGYGLGTKAPGKEIHGIGEYLCSHNVLKAHARAYHIYDKEFRPTQNGTIGIVLSLSYAYPKDPDDATSVETHFQFNAGWFCHPIFSASGDYPSLMKEKIASASLEQGYPRSRLPEFSQEWIEYIRGSSDFLGVNHYTSTLVEPGVESVVPSVFADRKIILSPDPSWPRANSSWLYVVPKGFGDLLRLLAKEYNNPVMYVTENGVSAAEETNDLNRIQYFHDYLKEMLLAMNRDGVNVKGYLAWSLLDNFEWTQGYSERFGLVHVDFNDPERKRTLKMSANWWKNVLKTRKLEPVPAGPQSSCCTAIPV
ncbi:myrosinase 1 isoform X2 [Cephus cinctus]|uniref:beta-glucosidase n=1 Tax=Cephus cinctus TaxID=211228 RepID=A0AAJ7W7G3_CEPCN|nr:myrosinase 1 isoform X2 [Cephus cinctus]